jgi:3D-(3,5/4)-trihydroxycyclohexane-1,2-dione acylhydrolase (decyclizing)
VDAVARLLAAAEKPLIIAGGGVIYSGATGELEALAAAAGIPVAETFAGKGAVQQRAWWQLGGIGLEGTPATNELARQVDLVLTVGSRLTDFATASQSLFQNPDVRFASINVNVYDAHRLGATGIVADAKRALAALTRAVQAASTASPPAWQQRVSAAAAEWEPVRAAALDPDVPFDISTVPADADVVPDTGAVLTQGQIIGLLQEHARPGDTIIAAAGGPPGDLQKVWDATKGRYCHLEFGFSCMGYEIPAALGVRLAVPDRRKRVVSFLGDGTFLMAPTELVTAAQESLPVTVVIPENHGYQVIHRLQMGRSGQEFGNEFRYRQGRLDLADGKAASKPARLEGDYLRVDLVQIAAGLGARAVRATTAAEVRAALADTRDHDGPVVIVVPAIPHVDLPGAGVWWDVAPAEVSEQETVAHLRAEYEAGLAQQRWHG